MGGGQHPASSSSLLILMQPLPLPLPQSIMYLHGLPVMYIDAAPASHRSMHGHHS